MRPRTAIFCANDLMAIGCYEVLRELGLRIPDDVAVMGCDDREIARYLHPPLTTVLLPHLEMGMLATDCCWSKRWANPAGGPPFFHMLFFRRTKR